MLPDPDPDNSNASQPKLSEDTAASQKSTDKGLSKKVTSLPKDGLAEERIKQPKDKISTPKVTVSSKRRSEDDSAIPSRKFIRRLVSPSQDKPSTNRQDKEE